MKTAMTKMMLPALMIAVAAWTGCQENSASLLILQNQVPGEGCTLDTSGGSYRTQGTLDVAWYVQKGQPAYYDMYLLVKNNLLSTENSGNAVEENCIVLEKAQVDLNLGSLGDYVESSLTRYEVPLALTVCPEEEKAVTVRVIPSQVVELVGNQINEGSTILATARVKLIGKRGSQKIPSNSIDYPIFLCNGCLIHNLGLCSSNTIPDSPKAGNPCNPAQDDILECCSEGADLVCPAVAPSQDSTATQ